MDFDYRLLAKYLTGMLSPEEMKQVEEWRELSIDNEEAFSKLMKLRVSWKFTQYNTPEHIEKALNGLNARINSRRQFQIFCSVMRYAAVILLLVSFSYVGWGYLKPDNYVTIRVEQGKDVKKIVLADGSTIWLKAGSSLKIPETFAEGGRKLSLQGEAFFDVGDGGAGHPDHPMDAVPAVLWGQEAAEGSGGPGQAAAAGHDGPAGGV